MSPRQFVIRDINQPAHRSTSQHWKNVESTSVDQESDAGVRGWKQSARDHKSKGDFADVKIIRLMRLATASSLYGGGRNFG